jgi:GNAT superfamily N-acetyltransferase
MSGSHSGDAGDQPGNADDAPGAGEKRGAADGSPGADGAAVRLVAATEGDFDALMPLVRAFYERFGFAYAEAGKRELLHGLLDAPESGRLLMILHERDIVGYLLLVFSFCLEFEGPVAMIDELFIQPSARGAGIGTRVLSLVERLCRDRGVRAVRLETGMDNPRATALYTRCGFIDHRRQLMTKVL